ncbi:hypothetical protein JS530_09460 [Bifidobacterium sp. LC6]|uniref:Uncharacterized protein n=1 Tax=Bifidobacterium colobi TaxID=2809026 RepID=A0ABS5UXC6_9BIFI|nr:hypothetical protein [Bifidobacterium colobi]
MIDDANWASNGIIPSLKQLSEGVWAYFGVIPSLSNVLAMPCHKWWPYDFDEAFQ